jgi:AcrR family transcriptional regulator
MVLGNVKTTANGTDTLASTYRKVRWVALELFAEKGFKGVNLRDMAEATGIKAGSLYNHMENKLELLFELIREHEELLHEAIEMAIPQGKPAISQLAAYIDAYLKFNSHHAHGCSLALSEFRSLSDGQQKNINALRLLNENTLKAILREGIRQKQFKSISLKMSMMLITAMLNEVVRTQSAAIIESPEKNILPIQKVIFGILEPR